MTGRSGVLEAVLVAGEPAVGADRAEDREDHRERGADREHSAAPLQRANPEQEVERGVDQADDAHPPAAGQDRPAGDRDQGAEGGCGQHQERDDEFGRHDIGFFPIWVPELVPRPRLSYRHGTIIESESDSAALAAR